MGKPKFDVEAVIRQAVEAGRIAEAKGSKDVYKSTEKRLYAYPVLKMKVEDDKERLEEFMKHGPRERSRSIVRFQKSGVRLTPEEIFETVKLDMEATIAADEEEVSTIERALYPIDSDKFILALTGKYFYGMTDEEIGEKIGCDTTTVWRNRKRLMQIVMTYLYGVLAVH